MAFRVRGSDEGADDLGNSFLGSRRRQMDIGEVRAFAEAFSHAVIAKDRDLINSYLCEEVEASLNGELDQLQLEKSEVLVVSAPGEKFSPLAINEFVVLTVFWGRREEVVIRTRWIQDPHLLQVRSLEIVERARVKEPA
jgi:hypothetical protein